MLVLDISLAYITGNINIACANWYKLASIRTNGVGYNSSDSYGRDLWVQSTRISGDISVFGDKYDLKETAAPYYSTIVGELKSLKNLKKLYICYFPISGVTGSKADLYNGGVNVTTFSV